MKKWQGAIFYNNHIKLFKCHLVMMVFYAVSCGYLLISGKTLSNPLMLFFTFACVALFILHVMLAYGSVVKIEVARRTSEVVFALLLVVFPIGTFLSMYWFLPATIWQDPQDKAYLNS